MALQKIALRPGVDRQVSQTAGEGGWWDSNRVRFRGGWPEKIGGWSKLVAAPLLGIARAITSWSLLSGDPIGAIGTNLRLYVYKGGAITDITPVARTVAMTNGISTVNGLTSVKFVLDAPHGAQPGDYLTLDTVTGTTQTPSGITVGGVTFAGDYAVATVVDASTLTIVVPVAATSTVSSAGGAATVTFFLGSGASNSTAGLGWGVGPWGMGTWGTPRTVSSITLSPRFWSLDNWGELLLANPSQGGVYSWAISGGGVVADRAELVVNGTDVADGPPLRVNSLLVAMPQRQLLLFGTSALNSVNDYDPMLVRWSDIEDFTQFRASALNSAGSLRLQGGGEIRGAFNAQLRTLVWTDTQLYSMQFIGGQYVYRFDVLGRACGLIGPKAFAELGGAVYWMSDSKFFVFRGAAPEILVCTLWDDVFPKLNRAQSIKTLCGVNTLFGEVSWWYPTGTDQEPGRYVTFNQAEGIWYGGAMSRTAWIDRSVFQLPIAADPGSGNAILYQQESGVDADGAAMGEYIESGWFDAGDGEQLMFIDKMLPDWRRIVGSARLTVSFVNYPPQTPRIRGPYTVTQTTQRVAVRARARQLALRIDGDVVPGGDWRLGALRADTQPDGRV